MSYSNVGSHSCTPEAAASIRTLLSLVCPTSPLHSWAAGRPHQTVSHEPQDGSADNTASFHPVYCVSSEDRADRWVFAPWAIFRQIKGVFLFSCVRLSVWRALATFICWLPAGASDWCSPKKRRCCQLGAYYVPVCACVCAARGDAADRLDMLRNPL